MRSQFRRVIFSSSVLVVLAASSMARPSVTAPGISVAESASSSSAPVPAASPAATAATAASNASVAASIFTPTIPLAAKADPRWRNTEDEEPGSERIDSQGYYKTLYRNFELSLGVSGVHFPHDVGRELHAVYHLTSITHGRRLRLEVAVPDADPHVPSTTSVYPTNDWHERETFDFFGIVFDGHPSLTRIQMPDDWPGHPQRKDYPLGGIPVEYKGATIPPPDQRRSYT